MTRFDARDRRVRDIRVLDLAVAPPGALAAMHLGEYGAEVTRVERDDHDSALWRYANRTKHVVPARDGLVEELAATADVVVVDLPATRARSGGAHVRAAPARQPRRWSTCGCRRTRRAGRPPTCRTTSSCCGRGPGLAAQQPGATSDHPVASVVPIITYEQGALGACAIAAALVERATRGTARACTVSGLHAVNAMNTSIRIDFPGIFRPFGADKAGTGASPQFRMYRCRDGVWLFVCALTPSFFFKLLEAVDLMDIMLIPEVDGEFAKFVTPPVQAIANERFAARMAELDSDQWSARFDEIGVPYAPVQTRAEWAASETVAANDLLLPVPGDGRHGRTGVARRCCRARRARWCRRTASEPSARDAAARRVRPCRSTGCSSSTPPSSSPVPSAASCSRTSVRAWSRSIRPGVRSSAPSRRRRTRR